MQGAFQQVEHPQLRRRPAEGRHREVILEKNHLGIGGVHPVAGDRTRAHRTLLLDENSSSGPESSPRIDPVPEEDLLEFDVG